MTEQEVKALVRKRDGYKCVRCGMTNEQHIAEYGRHLDVHRLLPGIRYHTLWCITVCKGCHGKLPKKLETVVFASERQEEEDVGVACLFLFLHYPDLRFVYNSLQEMADREGIGWESVAYRILEEACRASVTDYVI